MLEAYDIKQDDRAVAALETEYMLRIKGGMKWQ